MISVMIESVFPILRSRGHAPDEHLLGLWARCGPSPTHEVYFIGGILRLGTILFLPLLMWSSGAIRGEYFEKSFLKGTNIANMPTFDSSKFLFIIQQETTRFGEIMYSIFFTALIFIAIMLLLY